MIDGAERGGRFFWIDNKHHTVEESRSTFVYLNVIAEIREPISLI